MKNMGVINFNWNPIRAGGLSQHDIDHLKQQGWVEGITDKDVDEAPIGFTAPDIPGGYTMHNFSIPAGTKFLYNPDDERAIITACGNPTCWRYLMR
ncbi:hypothetical protein ACLMPM_03730 [Yersinia enterocolitica]|uniref:hypothetical protein n=1 Tax=Yersinia enterocolitica TaxID=630 RepID=UPI000B411812|nr:hypothetical protein [Yersinia enterocolitica]OVZ96415.1 hypothetical protein CBW53_15225 [Yersinia frederiksenii]HDL7342427.1 hypothetical protein [Yersinia enterocolitica]HDL7533916.1 hypothetical protein [Yersinia enterocolitica]